MLGRSGKSPAAHTCCIAENSAASILLFPFMQPSAATASDLEFKERLIANVKKEVKQIMEESVTKKFVHEDSSTVVSLCGAVEACLSQGLRRRALGLFKTSSTTALLHKISNVSHQQQQRK